tara:strand:- start:856 stop:2538 length:1683 start_codon:yes stop_codon:yes gene_type:complete
MVSTQNLEYELQELYKQKKYSQIVFSISTNSLENERSSSLSNLLGICRIIENKKDKKIVSLAVKDFKNGFLKEKKTIGAINSLANLISASCTLYDLGERNVNFAELIDFYHSSEMYCDKDRAIHAAMMMVFMRLNDVDRLTFHLDKIIKSKNFLISDLCSYGYYQCFNKNWSQSNFLDFGRFLNKNIPVYSENQVIKLSNKKNDKIKIGFLSSDIRGGHSITYFLKTVLENYDKKKFEIILFLHQVKEDETTANFINMVDKSINISSQKNLNAFNTIREFGLDIMIDLMGYTSMQRIELFKNRIAKKQILWLGYCNTTGVDNMDYIISDPHLIHKNEKNLYSEKIIYLEKIWNCHSGFNFKRTKNEAPFLKNNYITFGSFNNLNKINEKVINCWSKILKKNKSSKLIIKTAKEKHDYNRVKLLFKKNEVLDSVIFYENKDNLQNHLNLYKEIDIALDTFPYNGVTTSFEAIWMGLPVITMDGYNFNSRCGVSINKNLNMDSLIAKNEEDYVSIATNLSKNLNKYYDLRNKIFENSEKSPLFNRQDFSKNFFNSIEKIVNL